VRVPPGKIVILTAPFVLFSISFVHSVKITVFLWGAGKKVERVKLKDFACPNADGAKLKIPMSIKDKRTNKIFFCFMGGSFPVILGYSMPRISMFVKQIQIVHGTLLTK
jgi:hypothetical protein